MGKENAGFPSCVISCHANRREPSSVPKIVVSDSKGCVSVFSLTDSAELRKNTQSGPMNHEYEAWIAAFDSSNENIIFSGGDDAVMKCWDTRCSRVLLVNRQAARLIANLKENKNKLLYSSVFIE